MNCSTFTFRGIGLGIALFGTVTAAVGCGGGGDSADKSAASGGSAGQPANNAGGSAKAGNTSAGTASDAVGGSSSAGSGGSSSAGSGGKPSGSAGNSGSAGSTAGNSGSAGSTAGAGGSTWSGNFEDCDPQQAGLEHCSTDNPDHAGTSVCTEYYTAGYGKVFCADKAMTGPCPRGNTLYAICVNNASTYQYDDSKADAPVFFQASPRICDAQAGTWCGPR